MDVSVICTVYFYLILMGFLYATKLMSNDTSCRESSRDITAQSCTNYNVGQHDQHFMHE
jgi:hypothetical protein